MDLLSAAITKHAIKLTKERKMNQGKKTALINGVGVAVAVAVLLVAYWQFDLWAQLAWVRVALFMAVAVFGAVMGQAKDVAIQRRRSGSPLLNALSDLKVAYTSDKYGPAFAFRLLEWLALATAGSMFATVFSG